MNKKGESPLTGIICLWPGAIVDIPDGWFHCDGNNGTPDMTDLFLVGAGGIYNPGDTGGSATHGHTLTMDSHSHYNTAGNQIPRIDPDGHYSPTTKTRTTTGVANASSHIPPCRALCFIMKS